MIENTLDMLKVLEMQVKIIFKLGLVKIFKHWLSQELRFLMSTLGWQQLLILWVLIRIEGHWLKLSLFKVIIKEKEHVDGQVMLCYS